MGSYHIESHELNQACPGQVDDDSLSARLAVFKSKFNVSFESFSSLLRLIGAGVLVCALSMFLFKDWQQGNDLMRYLALLGFSAILSCTGLFCGRWIQEGKGARMFLALGLLSVPINFTVLGALVYSQWPLDALSVEYPSELLWQVASHQSILGIGALAWVFMVGVSWFGFRVLAPRSTKLLTATLIFNSSLLLIPARETLWVTGISLVMAGTVVYILKRLQTDRTLATREGVYARVLQGLPLVLLLGRALVLYSYDSWMYALLAFIGYGLLRQLGHGMNVSSNWRRRLESLSIFPALIGSVLLADIFHQMGLPHDLAIPLLITIFGGLMFELSLHCVDNGRRFQWLAAMVLVGGSSLYLLVAPSLSSAVFCMSCGVAVLILGIFKKQSALCVMGVSGMLFGLGYQIALAYAHFELGHWALLGIIGASSILAGSLLERYGLQWKTQLQKWQQSSY